MNISKRYKFITRLRFWRWEKCRGNQLLLAPIWSQLGILNVILSIHNNKDDSETMFFYSKIHTDNYVALFSPVYSPTLQNWNLEKRIAIQKQCASRNAFETEAKNKGIAGKSQRKYTLATNKRRTKVLHETRQI